MKANERIPFEHPFKSSFRMAERGVEKLDGRVELKRHITAKGEVDERLERTETLDGVELSNSIANISLRANERTGHGIARG